jgi:hypothetical protein
MKTKGVSPFESALPMWEILVPYSIGRKNVQVPYHREWDAKVMEITGGLTIMRAAKGVWNSPDTGKSHREIMIPVRIACTEGQIAEIAKMTIEHYRQEAVFVSLISNKSMVFHSSDFEDEPEEELGHDVLYVVRLWDGMDGMWMDVSEPVTANEAKRIWNEKTQNGTKNIGFSEIDYYAIYPADTKMLRDVSNYEALVEAGLVRP